jgi:hypothetical protein
MVTQSNYDLEWYDSHKPINYKENFYDQPVNYEIGDAIIHATFGEGIVIDKIDRYIDVLFKSPHGKKTVAADHKSIKRKLDI